MEEWTPLEEYPGYSASELGQVKNEKRQSVLATIRLESGHRYVSLMQGKAHVTRSLARIIANTFVQNPRPGRFTTPIHLNGDVSNCEAGNLMWRPRWFALRYTHQFKIRQPVHGPIRNVATDEVIYDLWDLIIRDGLLYADIIMAIQNKTFVFPTMETFEWAD